MFRNVKIERNCSVLVYEQGSSIKIALMCVYEFLSSFYDRARSKIENSLGSRLVNTSQWNLNLTNSYVTKSSV